jgi:electron transport complex protein RnfD
MAEETKPETTAEAAAKAAPEVSVAPGPHLSGGRLTTRRMMLDVLIALLPVTFASIYVFRWYAVKQLAICIVSCLAAEAALTAARRRRFSLGDLSAVVTAMILAFSIPATTPWYAAAIGSVAAIGLGKFIFGGLGYNIFNPAMVGRAFIMIAFATALAAPGYVDKDSDVAAVTQATPMNAYEQEKQVTPASSLFWGDTNGSLGETSALACLIGGLYLCLRRTASWQIPAGVIIAAAVLGFAVTAGPSWSLLGALARGKWGTCAGILQDEWTFVNHLLGGALLLGAFFIATDPVTSPVTHTGKWIFGLGIGTIVILIRWLGSYPEGVMFSVLLMNAVTPLLNRWTVPKPVGGPVPAAEKK